MKKIFLSLVLTLCLFSCDISMNGNAGGGSSKYSNNPYVGANGSMYKFTASDIVGDWGSEKQNDTVVLYSDGTGYWTDAGGGSLDYSIQGNELTAKMTYFSDGVVKTYNGQFASDTSGVITLTLVDKLNGNRPLSPTANFKKVDGIIFNHGSFCMDEDDADYGFYDADTKDMPNDNTVMLIPHYQKSNGVWREVSKISSIRAQNSKSVIIPETVKELGSRKGSGRFSCSNIETFRIPETVERIGAHFFDGSQIKKLQLRSSTFHYHPAAFSGYDFSRSASIIDGALYLKDELGNPVFLLDDMFGDLVNSSINYGVWNDEAGIYHIFDYDTGLSSTEYVFSPDEASRYVFTKTEGVSDGVIVDQETFHSPSELTLPSRVVTIGEKAFANTDCLSVVLPTILEEFGEGAFEGCQRLTSLSISAASGIFSTVGDTLFDHEMKKLYYRAPKSSSALYFPNTLEEIVSLAGSTFPESSRNIAIPASVKRIGETAFNGTNIRSFALSHPGCEFFLGANSSYSLRSGCLYGCQHLEKVTLNAGSIDFFVSPFSSRLWRLPNHAELEIIPNGEDDRFFMENGACYDLEAFSRIDYYDPETGAYGPDNEKHYGRVVTVNDNIGGRLEISNKIHAVVESFGIYHFEEIVLPTSITLLSDTFANGFKFESTVCTYLGTVSEAQNISWVRDSQYEMLEKSGLVLHCTDGDVTL